MVDDGNQAVEYYCAYEPPCDNAGHRFRLRNDLYCVEWGVKLYSLTPVTAYKTSWTATWTISHWRGDRTLLELLLVPRRVRWCLWSVVAIVATLRLKESTTRSAGLVGISSPERYAAAGSAMPLAAAG